MKKKIALAAVVITVAAVAFLGWWVCAPAPATTRVYVPSGNCRAAITSQLGTGYASKVLFCLKALGGDADRVHGSFVIEKGTPAWRLARRLQYNRQSPLRLTFNNLRTLGQFANAVAVVIEADSAGVMEAMDSVLRPRGYTDPRQYPAAFLPDTYEVYWTDSPAKVLGRIADHRDRFWNDTRRAKARALGLNPVKTATIASIVEEESADRSEHPTIARLYINRLDRGMKLQADPTVKFDLGDPSIRRLTQALIHRANGPYNTYHIPGLPPGPIRIADARTIDAVLDCPVHNYVYMCARADFSGRHAFAADAATHQANARQYHKALDARGIN